MMGDGQWKMNRAGLVNFWYYDEEIFDFADGKLLLRGANGSGKSVTMQSFLPVLLDGKKSPDRLDPFGSRARRMEDYLLGEKEVVDRDERTGYLFLEYAKKGTNQYITTGIGMQAKRNKQMKSWYFVITDNRRIGKDFHLTQTHTGEKIPLSEKELSNRIGAGGQVVHTQKEYMELVNRFVFGFQSTEAYEDLIKLLIQLRSPKLSKDFRPTVIYEILESALPPLADDEIRYLSDTIDHMDQAQQELDRLESERNSIERFLRVYDRYNRYVLAEKADQLQKAEKRESNANEDVRNLEQEAKELEKEIKGFHEEHKSLTMTEELLEKEKEQLGRHEVWSLEEKRKDLADALLKRKSELALLETKWDRKHREYDDKKDDRKKLEAEEAVGQRQRKDLLIDMAGAAEESDFAAHAVNLSDFERMTDETYDFTVWKREVREHQGMMGEALKLVEEQSRLQQRFRDLERESSEQKQAVDATMHQLEHTEQWFTEEQQELEYQVFNWIAAHPLLSFDAERRQEIARGIQGLYEETAFEQVKSIIHANVDEYREGVQRKRVEQESRRDLVGEKMEEKQEQITQLKQQKMIEPVRAEGTANSRHRLKEEKVPALPFYEAVEFHAEVNDEMRSRLEAVLRHTGILDSLITEKEIAPTEDAILIPEPLLMTRTLADYLIPDLEDEEIIRRETVDAVLRSIPIEQADGAFSIDTDGSYMMGVMKGHAPDEGEPKFIGRSSRKRYLKEQMEQLTAEWNELNEEYGQISTSIADLDNQLAEIRTWYATIPSDQVLSDLQKEKEALEKQRQFQQEQLDKTDLQWKKVQASLSELKQDLYRFSSRFSFELNPDGINQAMEIFKEYEDDLYELQNSMVKYQAIHRNMGYLTNALLEIEEELDSLKGDMNMQQDEMTKQARQIESIERQLALKGLDELRKEMQRVQQAYADTKVQLNELNNKIPREEADLRMKDEKLQTARKEATFRSRLKEELELLVKAELNRGFVTVEGEEANTILSQHGEVREVLSSYDKPKILEQLTKSFHEELPILSEYRMLQYTEESALPPWMHETEEQFEAYIKEYGMLKDRRIVQLHYYGSRVDPYYLSGQLQKTFEEKERYLDEQDRKLYEDIIVNHIGTILRSRIRRAGRWVKEMDQIMMARDNSSGLLFSISWKPQTAESEDELDTAELVQLLQRDSKYLSEADLNKITRHFQSRIAKAKELIHLRNEGSTLLQVLKEVLDYRKWFSFVLSYKRENESKKRELTNNAFYRFSGGEKAMAMYIPLFTAAYSRYKEAGESAPYIISLDEAFAGVDENNIRDTFEVVEQLGFNYIMNSQALWGDYDTVPSLAIAELLRPKNADFVTVMRYIWDGTRRKPVMDIEEEEINERYEVT